MFISSIISIVLPVFSNKEAFSKRISVLAYAVLLSPQIGLFVAEGITTQSEAEGTPKGCQFAALFQFLFTCPPHRFSLI